MFVSKCASRTLIVEAVALWLGIAGSVHAEIDSFFDVFVNLMEDSKIDYDSTGPTAYPSIDTEMVSMSLKSNPDPRVIVTELPSGDFAVDLFFDITYEIEFPNGDFAVDSFFDVFTEMEFKPLNPDDPDQRTFVTEIISMDLAGAHHESPVLDLKPAEFFPGHLTVLKRSDGDFQIDSFFDVFTELSVDGGTEYHLADGPTHMEFDIVTPEPSTWTLLAIGAAAMAVLGWRRRKK